MICKNCGREGAYIDETTLAYGSGDNLVVIENVPVISCDNCGVDLLDADTVDRLHELRSFLRSNPTSSANERAVKVADFQKSQSGIQSSVAEHQADADSQSSAYWPNAPSTFSVEQLEESSPRSRLTHILVCKERPVTRRGAHFVGARYAIAIGTAPSPYESLDRWGWG